MKYLKTFENLTPEESLHSKMFPSEKSTYKVGDRLPNGITIIDSITGEDDYIEYVGKDDEEMYYLLDPNFEVLGDGGYSSLEELGSEFGIEF